MLNNAWFKLAAVSLVGIVISFAVLWGIGQFSSYPVANGTNNGYGYQYEANNGMNMSGMPGNMQGNMNMNAMPGMNGGMQGSWNMNGMPGMNGGMQGNMNMNGMPGMNMNGGMQGGMNMNGNMQGGMMMDDMDMMNMQGMGMMNGMM